MELDGLASCLAHCRAGNGGPNDMTWKKLERLINLCPNCHFKSINKLPAIQKVRSLLEKQKERKPQFDRLYPPSDQLLDIKPETIYHFEELEQRAVLALCKYLCFSNGQYLHKLLPLLLRYLCTLHLANWPPHYFKNLFLMKYQHTQNTTESKPQPENIMTSDALYQGTGTGRGHNDIVEEELKENPNDEVKIDGGHGMEDALKKNLKAIEEEPEKIKKMNSNSKSDVESTKTPVVTDKAKDLTVPALQANAARNSVDRTFQTKADSESV